MALNKGTYDPSSKVPASCSLPATTSATLQTTTALDEAFFELPSFTLMPVGHLQHPSHGLLSWKRIPVRRVLLSCHHDGLLSCSYLRPYHIWTRSGAASANSHGSSYLTKGQVDLSSGRKKTVQVILEQQGWQEQQAQVARLSEAVE